jgi:hypothetical protein
VRHGHLPEREIITGIGPVAVRTRMLGEDGANLTAVQSPIELSHFVEVGVNLAVALCPTGTLAGVLLSQLPRVVVGAPGRDDRTPASALQPSRTPLPVDDVAQRPAVAIGAEIVAEHIHTAVAVLVAAVRDMRRDQHPTIGPQLRHRRPLEFADIDIERRLPLRSWRCKMPSRVGT